MHYCASEVCPLAVESHEKFVFTVVVRFSKYFCSMVCGRLQTNHGAGKARTALQGVLGDSL